MIVHSPTEISIVSLEQIPELSVSYLVFFILSGHPLILYLFTLLPDCFSSLLMTSGDTVGRIWQTDSFKASHIIIPIQAPGTFEWNLRYVIFKRILVIDGWGISCEIALIWTSLDFTNDHSTLVQVMAWRRQTTSHYLSQCWPRSMSPYGVTRPQWVN